MKGSDNNIKSKEVLELLQISRPALTKYVKSGLIEVETKLNRQYNYKDESVYKLFNKSVERKMYIYARVLIPKQKKDLDNQKEWTD